MFKKFIMNIFNIIVILLILSLNVLLVFSNTIFNKNYVIKKLQKNNYYEKTYYDIKENFKNYIMQSGLEENVLDDLYSMEKIQNDVNMVLDAIFENKEIKISTDEIRKKLDDRINEVLEENNRVPDKTEKESIQTFEDTIVNEYIEGIVFSENYVKQIKNGYSKIIKIVKFGEILLIVLTAIILIIMFSKKILRENIGMILFAVGIMQIIIRILVGKRLNYILILNSTFSQSLISLLNSVVNIILVIGFIDVILGIIFITNENKKES